MNVLPTVLRQHAAIKVDTAARTFSGWTELHVAAPSAAGAPVLPGGGGSLGLHCYGLEVSAVSVNGILATFEVQPPIREELPKSVTGATYDSQQRQVAAVSESAFYLYERQLQRERQPELSIQLPPAAQLQAQGQAGEAGAGSKQGAGTGSGVSKGELRLRVEFSSGSGSSGGLHFWEKYACTDNQVRRASAWLPCVDVPSAAVLFRLDLTCGADEVAVGPGQLQRQSWADSSRRWRTFHYLLPVSCAPCHLGFAVGPFRMMATTAPTHTHAPAPTHTAQAAAADGNGGGNGEATQQAQPQQQVQQQQQGATQLTHFVPPQLPPELGVAAVLAAPPTADGATGGLEMPAAPAGLASSAAGDANGGRNGAAAGGNGSSGSGSGSGSGSSSAATADGLSRSAHFCGLVCRLYEELLGAKFPLPALQQAFLPPEVLLRDSQVAAGLQLLSTAHLIQPRAIEQSLAARCAIARCLARQWFGVLLRAATPLDEWLVEGLSGWLEQQYVMRYMGKNELAYRRWRERQAIFLADNGEAPPLAARGVPSPSPWGPLYGSERLDPAALWSTKATAVIAMLEQRAGGELFRKHIVNVVAAACAALAAEQQQAAAAAGASGAKAAGVAVAGATPVVSPGGGPGVPSLQGSGQAQPSSQAEQGAGAAGGGGGGTEAAGGSGTRLLDTATFLNDLGRVGSFRKEMAPFAARWVYGRGVPHITAAFIYHSRLSAIELALKQTGSESAKRAADIAQRAAVTEGSNAGIIKAVVREGDAYTDHPVHLGGEAFVLAELKVTPVVEKKVPGRRGRKKKGEGAEGEEGAGDEEAASTATEDPVRWLRLDPAGELLCDIRLVQPERMLAAQLLDSRDVVAQAEAIQRLGELLVDSRARGRARQQPGLDALRKTLADRAVFYRVRCDAAMALSGLRDDQGQPAGLPVLLDFYRSQFFHPGGEVPRSVAIADPSEYYVAQAVATAVSLCREPDGTTPFDALLFLPTCLNDYSCAPGAPFSDYGLVAALCSALGNIQFEGFGEQLLLLLEKFLERDAVLVSPGSAIGCACLSAMAALSANGTLSPEEQQRVGQAVRRVYQSPGLPLALRHAALAAALQLAAAQAGPAAALRLALRSIAVGGSGKGGTLLLPAISSASFLLEEVAQLVAAAAAAAAETAAVAEMETDGAIVGQQAAAAAMAASVPVPMAELRQLAALLSAGQDCRLRHLAFVLLQLLAVQPPTLYRPPPNEAEDAAALLLAAPPAAVAAGGQAMSMGVTHRTGQQQQVSGAPGAAAAAAPRIRLQLGGGGGGGARSMAVSGGGFSGPALSGDGPAMSDARALSLGAVDQHMQGQGQVPVAAQGQVFSPVWQLAAAATPGAFGAAPGGEEASSRQQAPGLEPGGGVGANIMAAFGSAIVPDMPPHAQPQQPQPQQQQGAQPGLPPAPAPAQPPLQQQQQQPATHAAPPAAPPVSKVRLKVQPAGQHAAARPQQQQAAGGGLAPAASQAAPPPSQLQQGGHQPPARTPSPGPAGGSFGGAKRKTPPPAGEAPAAAAASAAVAPAARKRKTPPPGAAPASTTGPAPQPQTWQHAAQQQQQQGVAPAAGQPRPPAAAAAAPPAAYHAGPAGSAPPPSYAAGAGAPADTGAAAPPAAPAAAAAPAPPKPKLKFKVKLTQQ